MPMSSSSVFSLTKRKNINLQFGHTKPFLLPHFIIFINTVPFKSSAIVTSEKVFCVFLLIFAYLENTRKLFNHIQRCAKINLPCMEKYVFQHKRRIRGFRALDIPKLRLRICGKYYLKVPKCEIFDRSDFHDFYPIKSLKEGDLGVKIMFKKKYLGAHLGPQSSLCVCSV
jgi:hypothetical protein